MTHGIDTDFLVAIEVTDHPFHRQADHPIQDLLDNGHNLALAPQTLAEFIHIVSDSRRMPRPLTVTEAITRAEFWWEAKEVERVFPAGRSVTDFFGWLRQYGLGRKRLLDTLLAATFLQHGIEKIVTNNEKDYQVFGEFEIIGYR
jgi:predicted nucleic acid-binding protein